MAEAIRFLDSRRPSLGSKCDPRDIWTLSAPSAALEMRAFLEELIVVADVFLGIVRVRRQYQKGGGRSVTVLHRPDHRRDVQGELRGIEMELLSLGAVVSHDRHRAGEAYRSWWSVRCACSPRTSLLGTSK